VVAYIITGSTDRVIKPAVIKGVRMSMAPEHVWIQAGSAHYPRAIPMGTPVELAEDEAGFLRYTETIGGISNG
jgi:hypothetical protein